MGLLGDTPADDGCISQAAQDSALRVKVHKNSCWKNELEATGLQPILWIPLPRCDIRTRKSGKGQAVKHKADVVPDCSENPAPRTILSHPQVPQAPSPRSVLLQDPSVCTPEAARSSTQVRVTTGWWGPLHSTEEDRTGRDRSPQISVADLPQANQASHRKATHAWPRSPGRFLSSFPGPSSLQSCPGAPEHQSWS